jgi:hypothetical protein
VGARSAAFVLFVVSWATIPFPLFGVAGSLVPAARFTELAAVLVALVAREGAGGMVGSLTALVLAHALVYTGALALGAWLLSRFALSRLSPRLRVAVVASLSFVLVALASFAPLYDTQFHHASEHARLWELYW